MAKSKEELKELLKKLQILAERGVGGEKTSARKKLDSLLAANGMTEKDLADEEKKYYLFSYIYPYKQKLLYQILYKTLGASDFHLYKTARTRNKVGVYCTPAQKLQIELDFEFYGNLLDEEIGILVAAFIDKQDLYPEDAPQVSVSKSELSKEELEKWNKRNTYKNSISKRKRAFGMLEDTNE